MFHQLLTPIGGSLPLSFLVAALPVAVVLVLLGVVRRPAWQASLAGVAVALIIAVGLWKMPIGLALDSTSAGMVFACWPVMWIVFNSLILYNITVKTGRFDALRRWMIDHLPGDKRVVLVVIGFCFGALLEGVAGFGTPIAICSSLLIALGFPTLEALTFTLIFDTAPVAFGALGVPVTTLAGVTGLPAHQLGSMIGRQLPFMAFILPFYVMTLYGGLKSLKALWPVLLVAGGSFALTQFAVSNYLDYTLTDVLSALISLLVTVGFLKVWQPEPDPVYAIERPAGLAPESDAPTWQAWLPWIGLSAVVILWTTFKVSAIGDTKIPWPGLDKQVFITLYNKPTPRCGTSSPWRPAPPSWSPPSSPPPSCGWDPRASWPPPGPAASRSAGGGDRGPDRGPGLSDELLRHDLHLRDGRRLGGPGVPAAVGLPRLAGGVPVGKRHLGQRPVRKPAGGRRQAAQSQPGADGRHQFSGGVMGKMISPQNIATGVAVTDLKGKEGVVLARTFKHSIILTLILGLLVLAQQYLFPWMIPRRLASGAEFVLGDQAVAPVPARSARCAGRRGSVPASAATGRSATRTNWASTSASGPQTAAISWRCVTTRPAWRARTRSRSYSTRRQSDVLALDGDQTGREVDLQVARLEPGAGREAPLAPAQVARRRARNSPTAKGLLTKSSAPRSRAAIFSCSMSRADSTRIGTSDQARIASITALPSRSGRPRSRMTAS